MANCDVAIVGAGPYGLSAAAHLRARGFEIRVFGEPMSFWERSMPAGLLLRSPWDASQLSDPKGELSLDAFQTAQGVQIPTPIPIEHFVAYGRWFQSRAVPEVDTRKVACVDATGEGFRLTLQDGEEVRSQRVVIAGGITPFASRPPQFAGLPADLASHSSEFTQPSRFAGQQVVVIGGGQSALESAALLHEAGADVEVVLRAPVVHWTWQRPWLHTFRPVGAILYAWPDVGPAFVSHFVARPGVYRLLPRSVQDKWAIRSLRPTGTRWLKPRIQSIPITTGRSVTSASPAGSRVSLTFSDGTQRRVHHVLLATGYRVNVAQYSFLSSALLGSMRRINGYPQLSACFETSLLGLYFVGAPAAWSFGPLMRFVAGAEFAARAVTQSVVSARRLAIGRAIVDVRHAPQAVTAPD